jgi:hypothetical protein
VRRDRIIKIALLVFGLAALITVSTLRQTRTKPVLTVETVNCRTSLGTPCYTIHYRNIQRQNFREGWFDTQRVTMDRWTAVRQDGSTVNIQGAQNEPSSTSLYFAPKDQVIQITDAKREINIRKPRVWNDRPFRRSLAGDLDCSSGIRHFGTHLRLSGNGVVAGIPVFKWAGGNGQGREEEFDLAPSLDCIALKWHTSERNRWHVPLLTITEEALTVELEEPKPELFHLPANYKVEIEPEPSPLVDLIYPHAPVRFPLPKP